MADDTIADRVRTVRDWLNHHEQEAHKGDFCWAARRFALRWLAAEFGLAVSIQPGAMVSAADWGRSCEEGQKQRRKEVVETLPHDELRDMEERKGLRLMGTGEAVL